MKHSEFCKSFITAGTIILVVALYLSSCTMQTEESKKIAENRNKEALETRAEEKDAQFLVEVAEINLEEIQLGQLAQSKSTKKEVKDLAKMMEDGHSKSLDQLKELATKKHLDHAMTCQGNVKNESGIGK